MSKSLVERYEQILGQDPTSTIFVELAKALLAKGEHGRAIEVCQAGVGHHAQSVVGRVLWGKALISLGKPAEAMEQFDAAVGIDKENPYAYNLIGEVLLQKGLYRSALPLLRKAAALQPNDGRIRQWLEQTQQALQGGPAPLVPDASAPESMLGTATEANGSAPVSGAEAQSWFASSGGDPAPPSPEDTTLPAAAPGDTTLPAAAPGAEGTPPPGAAVRSDLVSSASITEPGLAIAPNPIDAALSSNSDSLQKPAALRPSGEKAPPMPPPRRSGEHAMPPLPPRRSGEKAAPKKALLEDIPDFAVAAPMEAPKVEVSAKAATQKIAEEYEQKLKQRLQETEKAKGLWKQHGLKIVLGVVGAVAVAVGVGAFLYTRTRHSGKDLKDALAAAEKAVAQDTPQSYLEALAALGQAHEMDSSNQEAWALEAYARAVRVAELGGGAEDREKAGKALERPGVQDAFPGLALAARYLLSNGDAELRKQVLDSKVDDPRLYELAGRLLLETKRSKQAVERFKQAFELSSNNARALGAVGDYYRDSGDCPAALDVYGKAETISPQHAPSLIGAGECKLEQQQDLDEALKKILELPKEPELPEALAARRELIAGRLLCATGKCGEAHQRLSEGIGRYKKHPYEFRMALGEAAKGKGDLDDAQESFEAALKLQSTDEAKEALGRVLLARDQDKELLSRFGGDPSRKLALLRGIAHGRAGDWRRARAELNKTQKDGKYPPEAVIQLALADAATGEEERAQEVLEKALFATKKAKAEARVALGQVYWKKGILDKARIQFEEAAKDPMDYEGGCALGRLYLETGHPESAMEPLEKSTSKNPAHAEAQHAFSRAALQVGKPEAALAAMEAWMVQSPSSAQAHADAAEIYLWVGKLKEAAAAGQKGQKLPKGGGASRVLAEVLYAQGDGPGAFAALQRANKQDKDDPETFCDIGWTFLRQGEDKGAAAAFTTATKKDEKSACGAAGLVLSKLPWSAKGALKSMAALGTQAPFARDRAVALAALSRSQLQIGMTKAARQTAEDAVAKGPRVWQAQHALGLVAMRQKDEAAAKEALQKAVELDPTHGALYLSLGDTLVKDSELQAAVTAYETFLKLGAQGAERARAQKAIDAAKKKLGQ